MYYTYNILLAQDGQRGSVAANTNWVGNAEGVANAIGYANAAVATLAGVAVVVLAVVGAVFTVKWWWASTKVFK